MSVEYHFYNDISYNNIFCVTVIYTIHVAANHNANIMYFEFDRF